MNNTCEIFIPIKGWEGLYEISNIGRVKSLSRYKCFLKPLPKKVGYLQINLKGKGVSKYYLIHRLVAIHFIDNPNGYSCVNHLDNNRSNNNMDNLEWCSHEMNSAHMKSQNRQAFGEKNAKAKLKESDVTEIINLRSCGLTLQAIADRYSVTKQSIHSIVKQKTWQTMSMG